MSASPPVRRPRSRRIAHGAPSATQDELRRQAAEARRAHLAQIAQIEFPEELPVSARRDEIAQAIAVHQVVIVCGETGSGKTTQLPKICLAMGRGVAGLIGHTQPRRLAARATAARIAQELKSELGQTVGYKIRFNDRSSPSSCIKLMTDGILLAETQHDRDLRAYDTIIIDEAHERSLNIDFLLGYLKQLLSRRPDLKVIVTSATLDAERFARHFADADGVAAPVIEVSGRLYPVEVRHRPLRENEDGELDLNESIADAVDELARLGTGDVLVFLPGEREIRDAAEALRKHSLSHTEILSLYARLSAAEQARVFKPHLGRRVVLATNVAETSLTVPGVRYVVDTGLVRVKRYSYRNKVEQLRIEPVAQSAAKQRAGRCGRVAAGVCIRLYEQADYDKRPAYTDPEVLRSSLAAVILRMKALHLGAVEDFPFIDAPAPKAIQDGYALLHELGAVDEARELTEIGRQLARLPLDPRIARMVLAAQQEQCLAEVLVIAAALSVQDPRERPAERAQAADEAHKRLADEKSDFLGFLKLWKFHEDTLRRESNRKLQRACREHFLSSVRMREWRDVHAQLKELTGEMGWRLNELPGTYAQIHRALLTGLLGNVGLKQEDGQHLGARGIRFLVHPGSALARKAPRWVMAAAITETTRLYARGVAGIEVDWLESVGAHLIRRHQYEPHWEKKPAHVAAFERATLYGLPIYTHKRIHYGPLDPQTAREIFIRQALVEGDWDSRAPFFVHNRKLVAQIEALEHKSRRPDVLVDDALIYAFYDSLVPAGIHNGAAFDVWRKGAEAENPKLLFLERADLMRHEAAGITTAQFPPALDMAGRRFALEYLHDPGGARDGVTMTVPLLALNQLSAARCDWLVPGLLKDKVALLAKSLPQKLRHRLGPLDAFAERFTAEVVPADMSLAQAIARYARDVLQLVLPQDAFRPETLPSHLTMNFIVVDEHGRQLAMGRSLAHLRTELGDRAGARFAAAAQPEVASLRHVDWEFGELETVMEIRSGTQTLIGYPALVDERDAVSLQVLDAPDKAHAVHRLGLRRLYMLRLKDQTKYLQKNFPNLQTMALQYTALGDATQLREQLLAATFERACMAEPWPITRAQFDERCEAAHTRLALVGGEIARLIGIILVEHQALQKKLQATKAFPEVVRDVHEQLARLLPKDFIVDVPWARLRHYPRYLQAIGVRLDKLRADPARDARAMAEYAPLQTQWLREDAARRKHGEIDAQLEQYRWLLEELRVQLYAQALRTPVPVSVKRLQKFWAALRR